MWHGDFVRCPGGVLFVVLAVLAAGVLAALAGGSQSARSIRRVSVPAPIRDAAGFDATESAGLFVGIRQFEDPEFVEVPYAVDDAVDLAHLFAIELELIEPDDVVLCLAGEPQKGVSKSRLESLRSAGAETCRPGLTEIYEQVERLAGAGGQRGLFVLAMASHGYSADGADLLLAADSRYRLLRRTGLSLAALLDLVSQSPARRRLVLLDACRERLSSERAGGADPDSGLGRAFVNAIGRAEGQAVLMAAAEGGYSYNDHKRRNGVFTGAVIEGLRGGAPSGADGLVTVRELAEFVDLRVVEWIRRNRPHQPEVSSGITRHFQGKAANLPLAVDPLAVEESPEVSFYRETPSSQRDDRPRQEVRERLAHGGVDRPGSGATTPRLRPTVPKPQGPRPGERRLEPTIGMYFRYAPAGIFRIGSPEHEAGRDPDETQHQVTLTYGLWIGETEVTQQQWRELMDNSPAYFGFCGEDCPVERVSWYDAVAFANRLSRVAGLPECYELTACHGTPGGGCGVSHGRCEGTHTCQTVRLKGVRCRGYRLPTEAEWEYAARAETTTPFWTGKYLTADQANFDGNFPYQGNTMGKYRKSTVHARSFGANHWGLYEMHGNVWEWTEDSVEWSSWRRHLKTGASTEGAIDPVSSEGAARLIRGGGWISGAADCRSANREKRAPGYRSWNLGFRLVRSAE